MTSTDGGLRWKHTNIGAEGPDGLSDVSCPTTSFCAAIDDVRHVMTTPRPTGGSKAWHRTTLARTLTRITCASRSLCAGIDHHGRVLFSTRPTGPASSWKTIPVRHVHDAFCVSTRLCLLATRDGKLIVGRRG
jgi:hypothetical protein